MSLLDKVKTVLNFSAGTQQPYISVSSLNKQLHELFDVNIYTEAYNMGYGDPLQWIADNGMNVKNGCISTFVADRTHTESSRVIGLMAKTVSKKKSRGGGNFTRSNFSRSVPIRPPKPAFMFSNYSAANYPDYNNVTPAPAPVPLSSTARFKKGTTRPPPIHPAYSKTTNKSPLSPSYAPTRHFFALDEREYYTSPMHATFSSDLGSTSMAASRVPSVANIRQESVQPAASIPPSVLKFGKPPRFTKPAQPDTIDSTLDSVVPPEFSRSLMEDESDAVSVVTVRSTVTKPTTLGDSDSVSMDTIPPGFSRSMIMDESDAASFVSAPARFTRPSKSNESNLIPVPPGFSMSSRRGNSETFAASVPPGFSMSTRTSESDSNFVFTAPPGFSKPAMVDEVTSASAASTPARLSRHAKINAGDSGAAAVSEEKSKLQSMKKSVVSAPASVSARTAKFPRNASDDEKSLGFSEFEEEFSKAFDEGHLSVVKPSLRFDEYSAPALDYSRELMRLQHRELLWILQAHGKRTPRWIHATLNLLIGPDYMEHIGELFKVDTVVDRFELPEVLPKTIREWRYAVKLQRRMKSKMLEMAACLEEKAAFLRNLTPPTSNEMTLGTVYLADYKNVFHRARYVKTVALKSNNHLIFDFIDGGAMHAVRRINVRNMPSWPELMVAPYVSWVYTKEVEVVAGDFVDVCYTGDFFDEGARLIFGTVMRKMPPPSED